ncbi:MAG: type IV toxin-antitoxin system AbiEi family antitoxin domain-containing protein [Acidimicrobiales bacterium]
MARNDLDQRIFEVALGNDGAVSRRQLVELGISESAIDRRLRSGMIERIISGFYIVPLLRSPTSRASAVLLAHPDGAFSHATSAERWNFSTRAPETNDLAHVVVQHGASLDVAGVAIHETRSLPGFDVVTTNGRRTTSPARTICDIAGELSDRRLVHLLESQLSLRIPSVEDLLACFEARARRGVRGIGRLGNALAELVDDAPFPESLLEIRVLGGLDELGVTGLRRQFRPPWYEGIRGIVDAADPASRTIIECDGRRFRQVTQAHDNDRQRDRIATSHGWSTVRVGWREFERDRDGLLNEIAQIILTRRRTTTDHELNTPPPPRAA